MRFPSSISKCFAASLVHLLLITGALTQPTPRSVIDFNKNWKFFLGDDSLAIHPSYDDSKWRTLDLPHDWSIEGDFRESNPSTNQGGALPAGTGWYRKTFVLPATAQGKNVRVEFDGIYRNSEVWINGKYLGKRPNGYISFEYDLTSFVKAAPAINLISVKVDNSQQPNSRWYSGSGIYRNTRLVISNKVSVEYDGVFVTTPAVSSEGAVVNLNIMVKNATAQAVPASVEADLYDAKGKLVGSAKNKGKIPLRALGDIHVDRTIRVAMPQLWSVKSPYLYKAVIRIFQNGKLADVYQLPVGIRYFRFDKDKGFFLNGKSLKILGVCNHHDLGALGAAVNRRAIERQLQILKAMGCNAIRTAHNPPAPELLELCDQMGFLVMDEAFDMWQKRKNKFDYHLDFEQWHKKDLEDMIRRDRNHPSVFMWSIGNEIREQFDSSGISITRELVSIIKALDTTRPVTNALTENFPDKNFIYQSGALDILGFNYKMDAYGDLPNRFPGQKFIAAETMSALATRGHYDMPSDSIRLWPPDSKSPFTKGNSDMTVSAYDHVYAYWGSSHEEGWKAVRKYDFMSGLFVWSGFDFLGEPVPYPWPARSSYYGIIDLAGFPKDVYYMYQSEWTTRPVLHLFPHWNWQRGQVVDVWAYYNNADEVELFLNGQSLGTRKKSGEDLHVVWRVLFEPGVLKAISRKNGKPVLIKEIRTAGKPVKLALESDRRTIRADGKDLAFVTVRVTDQDGNTVPAADQLIKFSVKGAGRIVGTDNGYQADTYSLKSQQRKSWKGMALAIVQSTEKKARLNDRVGQGNITLIATAEGLQPASITLKTSD